MRAGLWLLRLQLTSIGNLTCPLGPAYILSICPLLQYYLAQYFSQTLRLLQMTESWETYS